MGTRNIHSETGRGQVHVRQYGGSSRPVLFLQVTYNVNSFIDKNNDLLFRDLSQAMWKARHPLGPCFLRVIPNRHLSNTLCCGPRSVLTTLMKNLYSKNPNYIR